MNPPLCFDLVMFHHQAADDGSSLVHVGLGQRSLLAPRFRVVVQLAVRLYGNILFFIKADTECRA